MGMTIDKAIKLLIRGSKYDYDGTPEEFCKAYDMSIEILRKYQKITEIVKAWNDNNSFDSMCQISEVLEDGKDKTIC